MKASSSIIIITHPSKDKSLNKIIKIINYKPKITRKKITTLEANEIMNLNYLNHLPLLDKKNRPIGLYTKDYNFLVKERPNKFVIMAGGKGKRLLPHTINTPKPLVKVFNKPMLEHIIIKARNNGFENFFLSVNYLKLTILILN